MRKRCRYRPRMRRLENERAFIPPRCTDRTARTRRWCRRIATRRTVVHRRACHRPLLTSTHTALPPRRRPRRQLTAIPRRRRRRRRRRRAGRTEPGVNGLARRALTLAQRAFPAINARLLLRRRASCLDTLEGFMTSYDLMLASIAVGCLAPRVIVPDMLW